MSSIMRRRSGLMAVSVIGGSCLEVSRLRTPRSSGRDAARTITRSPHAAHLERCPARSALPRERVRSLAQSGPTALEGVGVESCRSLGADVEGFYAFGSSRIAPQADHRHEVLVFPHCRALLKAASPWAEQHGARPRFRTPCAALPERFCTGR